MKACVKCFFLFAFLIFSKGLLSAPVFANESVEFKVESLIREGRQEKALELLESLNSSSASYLRLKGILENKKQNHKEAAEYLEGSLAQEESSSSSLLLAQIYLKLKQASKSLKLIKGLKNSVQKSLLESQAYWDLKKPQKALAVLEKSKKFSFESYELIDRQKIYFLFQQSQFAKVFSESLRPLKKRPKQVETALYAVNLLKQKDSYLAEKLFDKILLLSPKNALLLKERSLFELSKGRKTMASYYISRAAHLDKRYHYEASLIFQELSKHAQALFHTQKIADPKKRSLQLFSIYIDSMDYEKALSMRHELEKKGLFENSKISYALMYSAFKLKDYKSFNQIFSRISSRKNLTKLLKLRELLEDCEKELEFKCLFS